MSTSDDPIEAPAHHAELPRVTLAGTWVHGVTMQQALDVVAASAARGEGGWVVTPNLDILHRLVHDASFAELIEPATLRLADGMPLVWASRVQGTPLPERVAGSDMILALCERAASDGLPVFLLGGDAGVADEAAEVLRARYESIDIRGTACPPFGFERNEAYYAGLIEQLRLAAPTIVFVALGCPKQEKLIARLRSDMPDAWYLGVGISFSFVTGDVARAPGWMRRIGLEWLHRLAQEPRRLARRYLVVGIPFAVRLLVGSAVARLRGRQD